MNPDRVPVSVMSRFSPPFRATLNSRGPVNLARLPRVEGVTVSSLMGGTSPSPGGGLSNRSHPGRPFFHCTLRGFFLYTLILFYVCYKKKKKIRIDKIRID